jgi:hypothetical protein
VFIICEDDNSVGSAGLSSYLLKRHAGSRCDTDWYQFCLYLIVKYMEYNDHIVSF